ncbi:hypothetical protein ACI2JA_03045 [Alkalihalobacillus sp. NPDC078783]
MNIISEYSYVIISLILLSLLAACESKIEDVEFVESFTMNEPVKNFNLVLTNEGSSSIEITYDIRFHDDEVDAYFQEYMLPGQIGEFSTGPIIIESDLEQTNSVTFNETFPAELLKRMDHFTLTIFDGNDEKKIIHVHTE